MHTDISQLFAKHTLEDIERFKAIDGKLDDILTRLTPIDETYVFTSKLWKLFYGSVAFIGILGGAVYAVPQAWAIIHTFLFPPKL